MKRLSIFFILLFSTLKPFSVMAQNDYILFISSYNSNYHWSKTIENSFRENLQQQGIQLDVYSEYLNSDILPSTDNWKSRMETIFNNYAAHPPKIVVILADNAWMTYQQTNQGKWKKVNILLAGIKSESLKPEKFNQLDSIQLKDFIPNTELSRHYNATGITEQLQIAPTINLMRQLEPDLKNIALVTDHQFYGIYAALQTQKYISKHCSDLNLIALDGRFLTTDSLYQRLAHLPPHTGVLLVSWLQDKNTYLYDYKQIHRNISSIVKRPIYILNDHGTDNIHYMGGYYSDLNDYGLELSELTIRLLRGTPAKDIPLQNNLKGLGIHLNQTLLHRYHLDASVFPPKSIHYYACIPTFWDKYRLPLIICIIVLVIGSLLYFIIFTSVRFTFYRRTLNRTQSEIDISFSNQQQISDALRFFLDAQTEQEAVNEILKKLLRELEADRAYIFEFDEKQDTSSNTYEICSIYASPQIKVLQNIPNKDIPWLYTQMQKDKILATEDLRVTQGIIPESERKILLDQGIISMLVAPLHINNKLWGYVGVDYIQEKKHWDKQDKMYLKTLAQILCIGIEHFRSEKRNTQSQLRVAELESLFSYASVQANVGVAQWNPLLQQGFATDQWFSNLGETVQNIRDVIGNYCYMHPNDRTDLNEFIAQAIQGKAQSFVKPVRIRQNTEWHWYKYYATVKTYHPENQQIELVFLSVDIDNLKKIEAHLTEAKAKAEESDKLKSAFIANMSHEIRTPLNAIIGFSNLLCEDTELSAEEKTEYRRIIATNNQLLLQLVNDILDISKIEAGVMNFTEDIVELNHFCSEVEAIYMLRAKNKLEIKFISDPTSEYTLNIDRTRLNQVLSNFLNNALKFTTQGYIHFGYYLREKEIYFYVEDTGIGIDPEHQKTIFQRFVKLNSFIQGTGLGLSICSTIIEKFGGKIGVESTPGKGSTFWFTIPRQDT